MARSSPWSSRRASRSSQRAVSSPRTACRSGSSASSGGGFTSCKGSTRTRPASCCSRSTRRSIAGESGVRAPGGGEGVPGFRGGRADARRWPARRAAPFGAPRQDAAGTAGRARRSGGRRRLRRAEAVGARRWWVGGRRARRRSAARHLPPIVKESSPGGRSATQGLPVVAPARTARRALAGATGYGLNAFAEVAVTRAGVDPAGGGDALAGGGSRSPCSRACATLKGRRFRPPIRAVFRGDRTCEVPHTCSRGVSRVTSPFWPLGQTHVLARGRCRCRVCRPWRRPPSDLSADT